MKFLQVFSIFIIFEQLLACKTSMNANAIVKQKYPISGSMDLSANPCEDFYQYACGNWDILHKDAGGKYHDTLSLLDYKLNQEMALAFSKINLQNEPKFVERAYEFYKSCMEVKEYRTSHYLNWLMEQENLKFPPLGKSRQIRVKFDWVRTLAVLRMYGLNGIFIEEHVVQSSDNHLKFVIELAKPATNGGFPVLTRDNLEQIIISLGLPLNSTNILKLWLEVQAFELDLKGLDDFDDEIDSSEEYDPDWPQKQAKDIPLPWLKDYIKILTNKTEVNPNMIIHLKKLPYFMALDELVKRHSGRFLCKYLEIRFLWYLHKQVHSNLTAEECLTNVRSVLPMVMNWMYEEQHPDLQEEFPKITKLFDDIRKYFKNTIQKTDHRVNLLAKINNMQLKLNNIPRKDTVHTLGKYYDNLDLNVGEFYANYLKLIKFNFKASHNLLRETTQYKLFPYLASLDSGKSSAPYFIQRSNTVLVPLSLLQQPIYQPGSDGIYKYSSLGFLLAREMFHGFDNDNLEFTNPLFTDSFNCLLETNPVRKEETIADLNGLRYAFQMFNDSRTDGMDVSLSKLFFLNFAQIYCGTSDSDKRISGVLTHFPEFLNIFQCNSSHRLYPHGKCDVPPIFGSD